MPTPPDRRQQIRDLVARNQVRTQQELLALLEAEGVRATQATISRDLRELGIRKRRGGYRLPDGPAAAGSKRRALGSSVRGSVSRAERAGHLVVIHTQPGMAPAVALALANAGLPEVIGALAGVDTVFVAVQSAGQARAILGLIGTADGRDA